MDLRTDPDLPDAAAYTNEYAEIIKNLPVISLAEHYSSDGKNLVILETSKAGNLYHFMSEVMGKLAVSAEFLPMSKSVFLLFPWQSFHREALECAGLTYKGIDWSNVYTGDCVIPSMAGRPCYMSRFTINFIRKLYSHVPAHDHSGVLYISRNQSATRRMTNEDDLLASLSVLDMPILKVYLEDYSFPEKISLFKGSKLVISPFGAGNSFLPFVNEGCGFLEIFGSATQTQHYESLAYQSFLNYRSVGADKAQLFNINSYGLEKEYSCIPNEVVDTARELLQA
jgi:capsular polysaccharide biosynthesis protein